MIQCLCHGFIEDEATSADPEGGPDPPPPPGKSQVIWVSLGNKQLDSPPGKSWTPPPPGKCWTPQAGTLKNDIKLAED